MYVLSSLLSPQSLVTIIYSINFNWKCVMESILSQELEFLYLDTYIYFWFISIL